MQYPGMLSVDSAEFRQRAPRVMLSNDPDTATQQTVQEMCRQIRAAAADPLVIACAHNAARTFRGGPGWASSGIDPFSNAACLADSCYWWCKFNLRFRHHGAMFEAWSSDLGDPATKLQLLIAPDVLVRMRRMEGDCAIYTMMLAALLQALGVRWEICTAAVDASQPDIFSHVWVRAAGESLDASHGRYPGWQVPDRDIYRLKIWDEGGREMQAQRFHGLHAYRAGLGRSRRGMGEELGGDNPVWSEYPVYSNPTQVFGSDLGYQGDWSTDAGASYSGPAYQAPSQNSTQWATFATNLLKSGLTLAEINAIQPGTVVSANGAILRQNPGYAVGTPTGAVNLGGSSIYMIGGLLLGGLFLVSMLKK